MIRPLSEVTGTDLNSTAFAAARIITGCTFTTIAMALAWRVYRKLESSRLLELVFLTLAWFWLLSPTQNPWYWAWALPFLPFARGRAWYAVSGLVMLYYLRFWLQYYYPEGPTLGTNYAGPRLFDFVVSWFEYAPWFVWLAFAAYRRRNHNTAARAFLPPSSVASLTELRSANP